VQSVLSEWQKDLLARERQLINQLYPVQKGHNNSPFFLFFSNHEYFFKMRF
jgi:ABC-type Zn2+ transport system substrate-binding protein/surface adhesin